MGAETERPAMAGAAGHAARRAAIVLTIARALLAAGWALAAGWVALGSAPDSPLRRTPGFQQGLIAIVPEGWAFFTRDPREPVDRIYRKAGNEWARLDFTSSSPQNLLGISRVARALNVELASLVADAPAGRWVECRSGPGACFAGRSVDPVRVRNHSRTHRICGEIAVERQPPVPWAWSRSMDPLSMPSRILRLEVGCEAD